MIKTAFFLLIISSLLYSQTTTKKDLEAQNKKLTEKIKKLEKIVFEQEKLLKSKQNRNKNQFIDCNEYGYKYAFPKLMMKEEFQNKPSDDDKIIEFKPSPFRLKTDSIIYDAINGNRIDRWERGRTFTSGAKTNSWVKISGYFVNRKWKEAQGEMWIKSAQVVKR